MTSHSLWRHGLSRLPRRLVTRDDREEVVALQGEDVDIGDFLLFPLNMSTDERDLRKVGFVVARQSHLDKEPVLETLDGPRE